MKVITVTANPALDVTAHVDNWTRGEVNRGQSVVVTAGGKGINVAINLAHAGVEVHATGWLGADNDAVFCRTFKSERINDDFVRIDGETRRNLKIVDPKRDETTDFNMPGVKITSADFAMLGQYLDASVDEWSVLAFGGSVPPGVGSDFYAKMVEKYAGKSHFLVVDASGEALTTVLQADALPDMIKPNIHELREVTGKPLASDAEIVAEAREWVARGIKMMVVSMGADGAWFVTADEAVKASPLKVDVASTVGAGDAMVAGTIRGVIVGRNLVDIAKTATAYSAVNIEQVGAGLPSKTRLESLKAQVETEHMIF